MVVVILLLRSDLQSAYAQASALQYGQTVSSSTASNGTEQWTFFGNPGDVVIIDMKSAEFDTYIELRGPDGALVTSDDDGGGDLDSSIIRTLAATGQHTITAGGFGDERGAYTLSLTLAPEFGGNVANLLAQANIPAGNGTIADGMNEIIIDLTDEDDTVEWVSLDGVYSDFAMGAEIQWGPGAAEDTCGIIFRQFDDDNYYIVEIDRTGGVWYIERDEGEWGESQGDTFLAVRTGSKDVNQVVLSAAGNTFTVYVNGQQTGTFFDSSNTSGEVAIEMTTYDESQVTNCAFKNVWVWDLGQGSSTLLPTPTPASPIAGPQSTKTPTGSTTSTATVTVTMPSANLRSGPGTDFPTVVSVSQGDVLNVIGRAGEGEETWYLVAAPGNQHGWLWSGIVTLSPSDAQIPIADNVTVSTSSASPVITNVESQGPCEDLTLTVHWTDADGDAKDVEWIDYDTGEVFLTEDVSQLSGSFSSVDWTCDTDSCSTDLRVVDDAGNVSNTYTATTTCS